MTENQGIEPRLARRVDTPEGLGRAVAEIRRSHGMTQQELAEWTGVHRQYIGVIESGQVSAQLRRLIDLLAVMGYDLVLSPRGGTAPSDG